MEAYDIVFVDNSGFDLTPLQHSLPPAGRQHVEFISLDKDKFDISKGKGYNELLLINQAVRQSETIRKAGAFMKVTGRYPIYNIRHFLHTAGQAIYQQGVKLYCDIKDHNLYDRLHLGWCGHSADVRLFACTIPFYQRNIAPCYNLCNDYEGRMLENIFFDIVKRSIQDEPVIVRFKKEPHFGGIEGSNVKAVSFSKNQDSLKGRLKRFVGNAIRSLFPSFYF